MYEKSSISPDAEPSSVTGAMKWGLQGGEGAASGLIVGLLEHADHTVLCWHRLLNDSVQNTVRHHQLSQSIVQSPIGHSTISSLHLHCSSRRMRFGTSFQVLQQA